MRFYTEPDTFEVSVEKTLKLAFTTQPNRIIKDPGANIQTIGVGGLEDLLLNCANRVTDFLYKESESGVLVPLQAVVVVKQLPVGNFRRQKKELLEWNPDHHDSTEWIWPVINKIEDGQSQPITCIRATRILSLSSRQGW